MPAGSDLPAKFGDFPFLNAADVASGRDFRTHMDRLIRAIDQKLAASAPAEVPAPPVATAAPHATASAPRLWRGDALRYLAVPFVLLLVAHHAVVNAFDLNIVYLQIASVVVPFVFGYALYCESGRGAAPAVAFAVALGIGAAAAMTVSQSLNTGDPIMPQTRFEWRDNIQFAGTIALSFMAGHAVARALRVALSRRFGKP
jgi:hypothetical protein